MVRNKFKIFFVGIIICCGLLMSTDLFAQQKTENIIIITTDGLRWQELFEGIDKDIADQERFNEGEKKYIFEKYWTDHKVDRREKLFPFIWSTVVTQGQIFGNRNFKNKINTANLAWLSFPGYSELFTGFVDEKINSNTFINNPNTNVLQFISKQKGFKNKVAAFTSWHAFAGILNKENASFPIYSAFDIYPKDDYFGNQPLINKMLQESDKPFGMGECLDVYTHFRAMDYLVNKKPRVLYIAYGETDEWAHRGQYKKYLDAAHQFDKWLKEIWDFVQSDPQYKDKTTLLITTDHGRGESNRWTAHERAVHGSDEIWMAVMGPDIPAKGEIKIKQQLYQEQMAQTIASLLGLHFKAKHPIADKIDLKK